MLGISSTTNLSIMGRIEFETTSKLTTVARVCRIVSSSCLVIKLWKTYCDSKTCRHSVKVIWMSTHSHDLRDNCFICPVNAENFCELFEVLGRCVTDREDCI